METFLSSRSLGEESLQMWELNKRLEAYLARVKFLEEENEVLKAEIQGLKGGSVESCWRAKYEEEVGALRATLNQAYQEKCTVELARDALYEEVQQVKSRCQRERAAQEEAKMFLSVGQKEMEEEKRTHIWLREKAAQLEKEIEALVEAHQEEMLGLDREVSSFSQSLDSFRAVPACFQPVEVEDYAKKLSNIWKGAVETYKMEVSQLEASLCKAKENLWKATERNRQNQLQLQQLEQELASLKVRKRSLEGSLSQQWAQQQGDAEKLQMAMEALEEEKRSLRSQISQVLEDRQQLMHLKMSLSLEVATYRTLLEAESTRLQMPATDFQLARGLRDVTIEAIHGQLQGPPMDRGRSGSRDVRLSPVAFPRGGPKLRGFQSKAESPASSLLGPLGPKKQSSVAGEFQKADSTFRHTRPTIGIEGPLLPKEASAFRLDPSKQSQVVTAGHAEGVAQPLFHTRPSLPFNSIEPEAVSGRPTESHAQTEESEEEDLAQREAEAAAGNEEGVFGGKEMEDEDEDEEEARLVPGKRAALNGPDPSQMVAAALETAAQEVDGKEAPPDSSLPSVAKSHAEVPFDRPLSLEGEEKQDAAPLGAEVLEVAQEDHPGEGQPIDMLEDLQPCEDSAEVNGGQEDWAELRGTEEAWRAPDTDAPSPPGAELPREERIVQDEAVLVAGGKEVHEGTGSPEWKESDVGEELPAPLGLTPGRGPRDASQHSEPATAAPASGSGNQEGRGPGSPRPDALGGALEVKTKEACGEAGAVEGAGTEERLSEERGLLWSPPGEEGQGHLRAEPLGSPSLPVDGSSAGEAWSPATHTALSAGEQQKPLFPRAEREKSESQEGLLHETDSALPGPEEKGAGSEVLCVEDALPRTRSSAMDEDGALAEEPMELESWEAAEGDEGKAQGDAFRSGGLLIEDMEGEGDLDLEVPKGTLEPGISLPGEDVASLQVQETLQEEQGTGLPEEQPPAEQKEGGEGFPEAPGQAEGSVLKEKGSMTAPEVPESEGPADALGMEGESGIVGTESSLQRKENAPECSEDGEPGPQHHWTGEQPAMPEAPRSEETMCPEPEQGLGSPPEAEEPAVGLLSQREDPGSGEILEHVESSPSSISERGGAEEEHVLLEETSPDHTAVHVDNEPGLAVSETPPLPSLERDERPVSTQDVEPPVSKGDGASILPAREDGAGEGACGPRAVLEEDGPCSEEPLAAEGVPEAVTQTPSFQEDRDDQGTSEAGVTRADEQEELEVAPGREPGEDPWQEGDAGEGSEVPKGEMDSQLALHPEEHCAVLADGSDPSYTQQGGEEQEEEEEEEEGPLEFSDQDPADVSPTKVSPLTDVTDLGEIVLEGEDSLACPKGAAESDILVSCEDECLHVLDPEDLIQQKMVAVEDLLGTGFSETFPEDVVGHSLENRKDSDILEIVEQALEFNQELIKAAGDELGTLGTDPQHSSEERSPHVPPASLDQGQPQLSTEAPKGSSPRTSSQREPHLLGESNANGLQEEAEQFTSELLNGIGQDKADTPGDDFIKEVTINPQFCTEGLDNVPVAETISQSPPPIPASKEGFRSGDISPDVLEKVSLDEEGLEILDENILDDLRQKTGVKGGKDAKLEAMPFLFGQEICRQSLEFQPEGDVDLQASEDN